MIHQLPSKGAVKSRRLGLRPMHWTESLYLLMVSLCYTPPFCFRCKYTCVYYMSPVESSLDSLHIWGFPIQQPCSSKCIEKIDPNWIFSNNNCLLNQTPTKSPSSGDSHHHNQVASIYHCASIRSQWHNWPAWIICDLMSPAWLTTVLHIS
jgi:hypothetical protein